MAEQVTVFARFQAKPGLEEEVREILIGNLEPTRKEKGCVFYRLFDGNKSGIFYFYELWESAEDLQAHSKSAHLAKARELIKDKLVSPSEVCLSTEIN